MPRELITVQVGQCGNQIGNRFWDHACREHAQYNPSRVYNEAFSSFFKNVDSRKEPPVLLRCGEGNDPIETLKVCEAQAAVVCPSISPLCGHCVGDDMTKARKLIDWICFSCIRDVVHGQARAVAVDMEEGVVNSMLKSSIGPLFDARSMLTDVSGAGNNWAHGHHYYGPQYGDQIMELVRMEAEQCDSLQGFLMLHSLGGGTGSGLVMNWAALETVQLLTFRDGHDRIESCTPRSLLEHDVKENFPEVLRFTASLFPSEDDDVVTSPYNSMLSLNELIEHADAVLPIENQALFDIVSKVDKQVSRSSSTGTSTVDLISKGKKPYDRMNNIAANVLLNLTSGMRFEGTLNVDLNDITMNMVPFPKHHFLLPSMSPLTSSKASGPTQHRAIDRLFMDVISRDSQLLKCDPRSSTYLACGLLARGRISGADVARNISTIRPNMDLAYWNEEGFKVGLCDMPPLNAPNSLLCLTNNCCISHTFGNMLRRFNKLFNRNVYVHHYAQYMEVEDMSAAKDNVLSTVNAYASLNHQQAPEMSELYTPLGLNLSATH